MSNANSQEQTIYRSLAGQIQLGLYCHGEHFPSAQEIARRYQVSYCPAQRALKALEKDGLIKLCRGKSTIVLAKPYQDFLQSPAFLRHSEALYDLCLALRLLSPAFSEQGLSYMDYAGLQKYDSIMKKSPRKRLYWLFDEILHAEGNQLLLSLYYDIGSFAGSAFLDILQAKDQYQPTDDFLTELSDTLMRIIQERSASTLPVNVKAIEELSKTFFGRIEGYFQDFHSPCDGLEQESFVWEPRKGRLRYCDVIAIDLLRKINQGLFPVDTLLPNSAILADIYHVSEITIRRSIGLLNKLGVSRTRNGVGTYVVRPGDSSVPYAIKGLMIDDNFKIFLESLQLLTVTCPVIIPYTLRHGPSEVATSIIDAMKAQKPLIAMISTISACLQAVVRYCPIVAVREIYGKLTLSLLSGNVLQFDETGKKIASDWQATSERLTTYLETGDFQRFGTSFQSLMIDLFSVMKTCLIDLGVAGADRIQTPFQTGGMFGCE